MPVRTAEAEWRGNLKDGQGKVKGQSGAVDSAYSFASRFESGKGTNPEELIAAAHAGCFSMALSGALSKAGHEPKRVQTKASVHLEKVGEGFTITRIELDTQAEVPGISEQAFQEQANGAKANCPVSRLLTGAQISLKAKLLK